MKPDRNAIILTVSPEGEVGFRPAIFVFTTPDGFAWVEPSYLEDVPAPQPAFHRVTGPLVMGANEVHLDTAENWQFAALAFEGDAVELDRDGSIAQALAWAESTLKAAGTTIDAERDRIKQELADDLA